GPGVVGRDPVDPGRKPATQPDRPGLRQLLIGPAHGVVVDPDPPCHQSHCGQLDTNGQPTGADLPGNHLGDLVVDRRGGPWIDRGGEPRKKCVVNGFHGIYYTDLQRYTTSPREDLDIWPITSSPPAPISGTSISRSPTSSGRWAFTWESSASSSPSATDAKRPSSPPAATTTISGSTPGNPWAGHRRRAAAPVFTTLRSGIPPAGTCRWRSAAWWRRVSRSTGPVTTAGARRSTCAIPTRTAWSCIGIVPGRSGPGMRMVS